MKKNKIILLTICSTVILFCAWIHKTQSQSKKIVIQKNGITVSEAESSLEFPNATLKINSPVLNSNLDTGKVKFSYTVENYQLGNQTPDADSKVCANSAKGQHIHLILNNEPYTAWYTPDFEVNMKEGHYVALSFLSRSYHESIKTKKAYTIIQFTVGKPMEIDTFEIQDSITLQWSKFCSEKFSNGKVFNYYTSLTEPMLFYSRPLFLLAIKG